MKSLLLFLVSSFCLAEGNVGNWWQIKWYTGMPVDHFGYGSTATFNLRYLVNQTNWKPGGPIFFYCGNEGDIVWFAQNTGFMWDIAPEFGAMVVFGEHRYYGKTMPFGNLTYATTANRGYLSSEQALGDYAVLLRYIKSTVKGASQSPVIAFGGSYGGMLAAWFRIKYPNIVTGSLASSAPILQFRPITPCYTFAEIVTRTFHNSGPGCDTAIKRSWPIIKAMSATPTGQAKLNQIFNLCSNSTIKGTDGGTQLSNWLESAWGYMAMIDYPYPANFLNPTPAWPVRAACSHLKNSEKMDNVTLLKGIYGAVSEYQNFTGSKSCYAFSVAATAALGDQGWGFQACSEMIMPFCNNGTDMFRVSPWNLNDFVNMCSAKYNITPQPDWVVTNYGGKNLRYASNIIFSNGDLDPWSGGGVTSPIPGAPSLHIIYIKEAAHHLDLRSSNPLDPSYVINARNLEKKIIHAWIAGHDISTGSATKYLLSPITILIAGIITLLFQESD